MYSNNLLLVERSTTVANQQSFAHPPGGLALKVAPLPLFTELPRRCEPVEKVAARPIGASEPGSERPKNDAPRARTGGQKKGTKESFNWLMSSRKTRLAPVV